MNKHSEKNRDSKKCIKIPHAGQARQTLSRFPPYAHHNGQWAKRIRSKIHCFVTWDDPDRAHNQYLDQRDDLAAGRIASVQLDGPRESLFGQLSQ